MKKILSLLLLAIAIIFCSCEKEAAPVTASGDVTYWMNNDSYGRYVLAFDTEGFVTLYELGSTLTHYSILEASRYSQNGSTIYFNPDLNYWTKAIIEDDVKMTMYKGDRETDVVLYRSVVSPI